MINKILKDYESNLTDWNTSEQAKFCYEWFDIFNKEFFNNHLEQAVISFEPTRINNLGHYHTEFTGLGLQDNINLNSRRIFIREKWETLTTLLHEMTHQYQRRLGSFKDRKKRGNYHNKEFITMMQEFGLSYNTKGQRIKYPEGKFVSLMLGHEIAMTPESSIEVKKRQSKLKKYSCNCKPSINIRVGVNKFVATCNICNSLFEIQE